MVHIETRRNNVLAIQSLIGDIMERGNKDFREKRFILYRSYQLLEILVEEKDSKHQFKRNINNPDSLAHEMIAFSNGEGGMLSIGVDDGIIHGLTREEIKRLNHMISN